MSFQLLARVLLLFAISESACFAAASQSSYQTVLFDFNRTGPAASHWTIQLHMDGTGIYTGATVVDRNIRVSKAVEEKLAVAYPVVRTGKCETKQKNIANTGHKTLSYKSSDGAADVSCTFNFSDNESLNSVADAFLSIVETVQAGDRLTQKHRYDRLGLDAELDSLVDALKNGRATELSNIAPVLQSIANDERVMERVQRKATRMLQDAGLPLTSSDSTR